MDTNGILQLSTAAALAVISLSFGLQKLLKGWKATGAETSLIDAMHKELERMSAQNTKLSQELNKLQLELITLNSQLMTLSSENQRLHSEVSLLTGQVTKLQLTLRLREAADDSSSET
jgi:predicted nuclease with TOPRIM domain